MTFCYTFGMSSLLKGRYVSITAPDEDTSRRAMLSMFTEWAGVYPMAEFELIAKKYNFTLLFDLEVSEGVDE